VRLRYEKEDVNKVERCTEISKASSLSQDDRTVEITWIYDDSYSNLSRERPVARTNRNGIPLVL